MAQAMPVSVAAAPQAFYAQGVPSPVTAAMAPAAPMMIASVPQAPAMMAARTQTRATSRERIALGLDWVRIPFPYPRFYMVQGPQRVVTETDYTPVGQPAMQMAYAPQSVAVATQPAVYAPAMQTAPVALAAAAPQVATVSPTYVSVPAAPAMAAVAPPPVAATVAAVPAVAAVAAPAACASGAAPASKETLAEVAKQLRAVEQLLEEQKRARAAGVPLPPLTTPSR
jgi:hypothetical protein